MILSVATVSGDGYLFSNWWMITHRESARDGFEKDLGSEFCWEGEQRRSGRSEGESGMATRSSEELMKHLAGSRCLLVQYKMRCAGWGFWNCINRHAGFLY